MRYVSRIKFCFNLRRKMGVHTAVGLLTAVLVCGCQYGYSRSALQGEVAVPPPEGYAGVGYGATWGPWPDYPYYPWWYGPPYAYYYGPWWYYPPYYPYPFYFSFSYYRPYALGPAPRRTFRR